MTMRLTLRIEPKQRLDLSPLIPERLAGVDKAAVERIGLGTHRAPCAVADVFRVRAGDPSQLVFEGGSPRLDGIGTGMSTGNILVEGNVGARLGRAMRGGRIMVSGNAGPYAASGLHGGEIEIGGGAGDFLGGPLAGEVAGMAGGLVVVRGSAGARAGDRLRRGIVIVEGSAGEAPGSRMVAGTLIVCGGAGPLPGYLMRRGTLILGQCEPLPTFAANGAPAPVFIRLLARAVEEYSRRAARLILRSARRYAGDMATLGKGELLLPSG
jgi:formylmethanofuran dehydrogenase subunit C